MRQKTEEREPAEFAVSVEAFDSLNGTHKFSLRYKRRKRKMLRAYRKSVSGTAKSRTVKAAAIIASIALAPGIVYAATGSKFFHRIWGTWGRENVTSHTETKYDMETGSSCIVTYPAREYTDKNLDKADELIGDAVSHETIVKEIGDTTLTILTSVYDGNAAVVEFTLEREGGVNALQYSRLDNESKGAWFPEYAPFMFHFMDCSENIYVDMERSTEETLYCYDYMTADLTDEKAKGLTLEICYRIKDDTDEDKTEFLFVPLQGEAEKADYVNAGGGTITLSPMSMKVETDKGLGLSAEQAYDPWNFYYVAVNDRDGSNYVVHEHEIEGVHSCSVETDNVSYTCGTEDNTLIFVFNRLIDIRDVRSVTVNETEYVLKS